MFVYLDTETVGLTGVVKLIQYAVDNGPVRMIPLLRGWEADPAARLAVAEVIGYLERPDVTVVIFNSAFDMFHMYRLKHKLLGYEYDSVERPVMPFACKVLDLQVPAMLKSPLAPFAFGRSAGKSVAVVRRIPKICMEYVSNLVCDRLKPLLPQSFGLSVSIHKQPKRDDLVSLSFRATGRVSLKGLMKEYGLPTIDLAEVWPLPEKGTEKPWLPYPNEDIIKVIEPQCDRILMQPGHDFYRYSKLDILYLKALYEKLGRPDPDYNSDCCHNMAYLRYYGFDIDRTALDDAEEYYGSRVERIEKEIAGINLRSSKDRLQLLQPYFPILASTKKSVLKHLAEHETGRGAELAAAMVEYGPSRQRLLQIQKVKECRTGRAHPDLRVMGTSTNRMAGTSGINWQGIGSVDEYELPEEELDELPEDFLQQIADAEEADFDKKQRVGLRHAILTPCVGDWASFEVRIAAKVYDDAQLQEDIHNKVDLHTLGCVQFHPEILSEGISYEDYQVRRKDELRLEKIRKGMKGVIFGSFYFCTAHAVAESLNVPEYEAQAILDRLYDRYPGMKRYRAWIEQNFLTADTDRWTKNSVRRMKRSLTDLTGFDRHWNFEASVAELMWELGNSKKIRSGHVGKIIRNQTKGVQTYDRAITSALLGSAIAVQAAVSRQAGNFRIQATGATLNKQLQAEIWNKHRIPTLQIHDELFPPHHPNYEFQKYSDTIEQFVTRSGSIVPDLKFDYAPTERWSDK